MLDVEGIEEVPEFESTLAEPREMSPAKMGGGNGTPLGAVVFCADADFGAALVPDGGNAAPPSVPFCVSVPAAAAASAAACAFACCNRAVMLSACKMLCAASQASLADSGS